MAARVAPLLKPPLDRRSTIDPVRIADPMDAPRLDLALVAASPLVLAGLRAGLGELGGFDVVLEAPTLEEARTLGYGGARVVIVDALPPFDSDAGPPLVVLGEASLRGAAIVAALGSGITVLPQRASIEAIGAAASAAAAGLVSSSAALWAEAWRDASRAEAIDPPEPLTPREQQVLRHMSDGLANREIAQALQISPHTAKYHVGQIIAKLQASSRAHAVAKALRSGWVTS